MSLLEAVKGAVEPWSRIGRESHPHERKASRREILSAKSKHCLERVLLAFYTTLQRGGESGAWGSCLSVCFSALLPPDATRLVAGKTPADMKRELDKAKARM